MRHKLLGIISASLLLLSLCSSIQAYDTPGDQGENIVLSFDATTGTLTLGGQGKLPDTYASDQWFSDYAQDDEVVHVIISDEITYIGAYRFYKLPNLQSVHLGSVTQIGEACFKECGKLSSIDLSTVNSVGASAFNQCIALKSIVLPKTHGFNCFSGSGIESIDFGECTAISEQAFYNCQRLKNLTIPGTIETINAYAFDMCVNLENLYLNEGTKVIGDNAFLSDEKLTLVCLPNSITSVADTAFSSEFTTLYRKNATFTDSMVNLDLSDGSIFINYATDGRHSFLQGENIIISSANDITITSSAETANYVSILNGAFDVTINGINIYDPDTGNDGIAIANYASVNLTICGENTIYKEALNADGIYVNRYSSVVISGTGTLNLTGGEDGDGIKISARAKATINSGTIHAIGGFRSSGIGVFDSTADPIAGGISTLVINGGTINCQGGKFGAGIGSWTQAGTVVINGGTVTAIGGEEGAGIGGGGLAGRGGVVIINGGIVTAIGGENEYGTDSGADIGTGCGPSDDTDRGVIAIYGGTVNASNINSEDYSHLNLKYAIRKIQLFRQGDERVQAIPNEIFTAEIRIVNLSSDNTDTLAIASYSEDGQMLSVDFFALSLDIGETVFATKQFDNKDSQIANVKAFVISKTFVSPLSKGISFQ